MECPTGLVNHGNTCYFNAVLQSLAQTPYLMKSLDQSPIKFAEMLHRTLSTMRMCNGEKSLSPKSLFTSLVDERQKYGDGGQHDAHEVLRDLLEIVHQKEDQVSFLIKNNIIKSMFINFLNNFPGESFGLKFIPNPKFSESFRNLYPHQTVSFRSNPKLVFNPNQSDSDTIQNHSELVIRMNPVNTN